MEPEKNPKVARVEEERIEITAAKVTTQQQVEPERERFRALILANPNYFGNVRLSPFQPVLNIMASTFYEEVGCVGFQPQFNLLEAVVYVKQPLGYGGDICSQGTPQYVRFYISYDNGVSFEDLGMTNFTAYDIPETTTDGDRLEYAVSLEVAPTKKFCFKSNLALVRAILSWNVPPPPNEPDFIPVWGNIHNTHIQIDPLKLFSIGDILSDLKIKFPPQLSTALDLNLAVTAAEPKALSVADLQKLYKDKGVEPHRLALTEVQRLIREPALGESWMASGFKGALAGLDIDLENFIVNLFPTDGSTRYEELVCIGLNANQDTLVGIIRVKLPFGYLGDPCTKGSREYVTFWADFDNNGTFETCLGTTSVNVFDIENIPQEGLEYAIFLPVDLTCRRQPCEQGPKVVRIRAILSWQDPPDCPNPNFVPIWGNRLETLIHIRPGPVCQQGTHIPFIETVGSMSVTKINPITGLANGAADLAGFTAQDSPFGRLVVITGHIANPTDISNGATPLKYRVSVRKVGDLVWQPLTDPLSVGRTQLLNGIPTNLPAVTLFTDADHFYEYQEDLTDGPGNAMIFVKGNILARWQTAGMSGLWQIRIEAKDSLGTIFFGAVVTVRLDNQAPQFPLGSFQITSGGGACADFIIGDVITGTYAVTDEHFGRLALAVLPALGGAFTSPPPFPGAVLMPLVRAYSPVAPPGVPTTGEAGTWSLDTTGMPKCGYVIRLSARDRTIVNSGFIGLPNETFLGLCLREPEGE